MDANGNTEGVGKTREHKTKGGARLAASGGTLHVYPAAGGHLEVRLGKTTIPMRGKFPPGARALGGLVFEQATADWVDRQVEEIMQAEHELLEQNVPGLAELSRVASEASSEQSRYHRQFARMMEDEYNDGAAPPKPEDRSWEEQAKQMQEKYPRAALYLRAKQQMEGASWADNTGEGEAGRKAMEILASGGSAEQAQKALEERRKFTD